MSSYGGFEYGGGGGGFDGGEKKKLSVTAEIAAVLVERSLCFLTLAFTAVRQARGRKQVLSLLF